MNASETRGWKTKLFGDNSTNFYGWILGGLVVIGVSLWLAGLAIDAGAFESPVCLLLLAIYLVLLGILGLTLQNYHSRVAQSLDTKRNRNDDSNAA